MKVRHKIILVTIFTCAKNKYAMNGEQYVSIEHWNLNNLLIDPWRVKRQGNGVHPPPLSSENLTKKVSFLELQLPFRTKWWTKEVMRGCDPALKIDAKIDSVIDYMYKKLRWFYIRSNIFYCKLLGICKQLINVITQMCQDRKLCCLWCSVILINNELIITPIIFLTISQENNCKQTIDYSLNN